jgi:hypothetical protein
VIVAAAMAVGVLFAAPGAAEASMTYCDWDPLVAVITPAGHIVPLYDSVWTSSVIDLGVPLESTRVSRIYDRWGHPETLVTVAIYVPTGLLFSYSTLDEVTTGLLGSGTVLSYAYGTSRAPTYLHFVLHEA